MDNGQLNNPQEPHVPQQPVTPVQSAPVQQPQQMMSQPMQQAMMTPPKKNNMQMIIAACTVAALCILGAVYFLTGDSETEVERSGGTENPAVQEGRFVELTAREHEELEQVFRNMENVTSGTMTMELVISMFGFNVTTISEVRYDNYGTHHMIMRVNEFGSENITEIYAVERDGRLYQYMRTEAMGVDLLGWFLVEEEMTETMTMEEFSHLFDEIIDVRRYVDLVDGMTKFVLTLPEEAMSYLIGEEFEDLGLSSDMTMEIYVLDGYIVKMHVELTSQIEGMSMSMVVTIHLADFNEVGRIVIPEEVLEARV